MKTNVLHLCSFPVAAVAIAIATLSPFAACLAVTVAGVLSVGLLDYGRTIAPVSVTAEVIPFGVANSAPAATREAA
jgi:hypothetical protein